MPNTKLKGTDDCANDYFKDYGVFNIILMCLVLLATFLHVRKSAVIN